MITIVNYNAGNIVSIKNMLKKIGATSTITSDPKHVMQAEKLIIPGVGHFDHGMNELKNLGLDSAIKEVVESKHIPVLGICLGAQIMGNGSEEGNIPGLQLLDFNVVKFDKSEMNENLKIPHMGWAEISFMKDGKLSAGMPELSRFYFVHAFHFKMHYQSDTLATAKHGYEFAAAFEKDNVFGVQFHPEKSHKFGMQLLKNFVSL